MRTTVSILAWTLLSLAFVSGVSGLGIDTVESVVHFEDGVELTWEEAGESISIEVQGPDGESVFLWTNGTDATGGGSLTVPFARPLVGDFSAHATSVLNGTVMQANTSFEVGSPELSISSLLVNGSRSVDRTHSISVTAVNDGAVGVTSVLFINSTSGGNTVAIVKRHLVLGPDDEWNYVYDWTPENASEHTIEAVIWPVAPGEFNTSDNSLSANVNISDATTSDGGGGFDPDSLDVVVVIVVVVSTAIAAGIGGVFALERSRFSLFCLFSPLYHKIGSQDLFNNEVRGMVFGYITANEGANYSRIKRELKLPNGTLAYHLKVLTRHGHVLAVRDGGLKRFFTRAAVPAGRRLRSLNDTQERILKRLGSLPGMTQRELALSMELTQSAISYNLNILERKGLVTGVGKKNIQYLLTPGPMAFTCGFCGTPFSAETASFCPKCGERVEER